MNPMEMKRVGVMIPAYNAERWIAQAIMSMLSQTYHNQRIVVLDDGSTDTTIEIAKRYTNDYRLEIFAQEHKGCPAARNKCLELLLSDPKVEYIAWMDADDRCDNDRIALEMHYLEENPDIDIVRTSYDWIDENGAFIRTMAPRPANASMLVPRKWFEQFRIPEGQWHGSDGKWIDIVAAAGARFGTIENVLYSQRRHPEQISLRKRGAK